jgi:transposase
MGTLMMTATVLSGPERRRRWTAAEKARIVEESLAAGASIAEVARRHDVHRNLLDAWRRQARAGTLVREAGARMALDGAGFSRVVVAPDTRMLCAPQSEPGAGRVCIEVVLRNGRVLRVPEDLLPARVAALADALEGSGR